MIERAFEILKATTKAFLIKASLGRQFRLLCESFEWETKLNNEKVINTVNLTVALGVIVYFFFYGIFTFGLQEIISYGWEGPKVVFNLTILLILLAPRMLMIFPMIVVAYKDNGKMFYPAMINICLVAFPFLGLETLRMLS